MQQLHKLGGHGEFAFIADNSAVLKQRQEERREMDISKSQNLSDNGKYRNETPKNKE